MKRWLVENQETAGIYSVTSARGFKPTGAVVEVPESIDAEDFEYLTYDSENDSVAVDMALKSATSAVEASKNIITDMFNTLNTEVYAEMKSVFGTINAESAAANYQTWKIMAEKPGDFMSANLIVEKDLNNSSDELEFSKGQLLNTVDKIERWANLKVKEAVVFSAWRLNKIQTFNTNKAALQQGG